MKRLSAFIGFIAAAGLGWAALAWAQNTPPGPIAPPPAPQAAASQSAAAPNGSAGTSQSGIDVLTRGPIHEAFAQPISTGSVRPLVVPKKPPDAIDEQPPDARPADQNATWIDGYWGWDDDRNDFLWVSGVWRIAPPGQQWVPGYWTQVSTGFEWIPGFWNPVSVQEVAYLPEPPASMEQGPISDAPGDDYFWVPGCWRWGSRRYAWTPGFWSQAQPNWLWMPASYCWSPRGWLYRDGYWDYPIAGRGLAFAPAYFSAGIFRRPGFFYSPTVAIDSGLLSFYLFTRPNYGHYYFGDYYAATYDSLGIFPWFGVRGYRGYVADPLFSYYQWFNRTRDPNWIANLRGWHAYYRTHADQRPPRTLAAMQQVLARSGNRPDREFLGITSPLSELQRRPNARVHLTSLSSQQKTQIHQAAQLVTRSGTERAELETKGGGGATVGAAKTSTKLTLPNLGERGQAGRRTPAIGVSSPGAVTSPGTGTSPSTGTPPSPRSFETRKVEPSKSVTPKFNAEGAKGAGKSSVPERFMPERKIPQSPQGVAPPKTLPEHVAPQRPQTVPEHEGGTQPRGGGSGGGGKGKG